MTGKYTPLENYSRDLPANQKEGSHVEAFAWMDAGWLVDTVNFTEKWVRFARQ